jgi:spore coat protein H
LAGLVLLSPGGLQVRAAVQASPAPEPGADLFTNCALHSLVIELSPTNLQRLRTEPRRKVPATVREGPRVYTNVAVHLKGALGSFRGVDDKPGLSLNFGTWAPSQRFHGLRKVMLNNSVQDPSYLNEKLAGDLFRAAGVPTPRTSHALVELNGRRLGLYVLKEGFSKDFLGLYFSDVSGNLYDLNRGFYDLGPGGDLPQRFRLDSGSGPPGMADLAKLIAACDEKDAAQRWSRLNGILDLRQFLSFMAMEITTCHCDGYSVYGHNFRLYHDPTSGKFSFIPNDLDRMFQECRVHPLNPGFSAKAAVAVFQTPEGRRQYTERCAWLCTNVFNLERLTNQVDRFAARLRPALASWRPDATNSFDHAVDGVRAHLLRRAETISREFAAPPASSEGAAQPAGR